MTRICVQATVEHPPTTTERLLQAYMNDRRRSDGSIALLLRIRFREGGSDDLSLAHDVIVHFSKDRHVDNHSFIVNWSPSGEGPYPGFPGMMNVLAEPDVRHSRIELDGAYAAPGGIVGRAFDATIGSAIARSSLTDFVERVAADLKPVASSTTRQ
ncbi:MAG: hypothetical protein M3R30_10200 [Candidatus Eremiobacteraeota bacterium]|nr:hypothetical protein [Candidatus Eremiobacteraeota bacterium]